MQVGKDGYRLLEAIWSPAAPGWLRQLPAVDVLRRVWVQRFLRTGSTVQRRAKGDEPPGALRIGSPYDIQARYGHKRGHGWLGYKAHVTEVCTPGCPQVIVHVATTEASLADVETVTGRHTDLAQEGLAPAEHLADAGYISVGHILTAAAEHGIALVGPLPSDSHWQAQNPDAYDLSHFAIDWEARQVTCPQGKTARAWRNDVSRDGLAVIHVAFPPTGCFRCPDRPRCTRANAVGRSLTLRPRAQYEAQQRIRVEQATDTWKKLYAQRSGVEGAIAQASRRSNIHHARYRGLERIHLQHILTALALNIIRVDAWLNGLTSKSSWTTRLAILHHSLTPVAL
ncbi:transposase [Streptomyces sp. NRRL B-1347]|uniref:transposase n=1 Tax=Streptomyces sp. NRRL B-1347 TaxID=1476877 RepID=UPI000689BDAF|nr:transposase [Streptomyces sp. NRRL B-1347]